MAASSGGATLSCSGRRCGRRRRPPGKATLRARWRGAHATSLKCKRVLRSFKRDSPRALRRVHLHAHVLTQAATGQQQRFARAVVQLLAFIAIHAHALAGL